MGITFRGSLVLNTMFILFYLKDAAYGAIRDVLLNDDVYPLLEEVGYQGVPGRETRSSIKSLVEYVKGEMHT